MWRTYKVSTRRSPAKKQANRQYLVAVHGEKARDDTLLEASTKHDSVVLLIHGSKRRLRQEAQVREARRQSNRSARVCAVLRGLPTRSLRQRTNTKQPIQSITQATIQTLTKENQYHGFLSLGCTSPPSPSLEDVVCRATTSHTHAHAHAHVCS